MYVEKIKGMIDIIQEERKKFLTTVPHTQENNELPLIGTKYEPGQTGFRPKKGYLLVEAIDVPKKQTVVIVNNNNQLSISDFLGVHPLIGVVFEVGEQPSEFYKPGDVICLSQSISRPGGIISVVVNGTVAQLIHEGDILGIDENYKK